MSRIEKHVMLWLSVGILWLSVIPVMIVFSIENDMVVVPWLTIGLAYMMAFLRFLCRPEVTAEYEKRILDKRGCVGVHFSLPLDDQQRILIKSLERVALVDYSWVVIDAGSRKVEIVDGQTVLNRISDMRQRGVCVKLLAYRNGNALLDSERRVDYYGEFIDSMAEIMLILLEEGHYRVICRDRSLCKKVYTSVLHADCQNVSYIIQIDPDEPLDTMHLVG